MPMFSTAGPGGQREPAVRVQHRAAGPGDQVQEDLRHEERQQHEADASRRRGRGGSATPRVRAARSADRRRAGQARARPPTPARRTRRRRAGVPGRSPARSTCGRGAAPARREQRPGQQLVVDDVRQRVDALIAVAEVGRAQDRADRHGLRESGRPAHDRPRGARHGVRDERVGRNPRGPSYAPYRVQAHRLTAPRHRARRGSSGGGSTGPGGCCAGRRTRVEVEGLAHRQHRCGRSPATARSIPASRRSAGVSRTARTSSSQGRPAAVRPSTSARAGR